MISATSATALAIFVACAAATIYYRVTRFSIKYIRGPTSGFWLGNTSIFFHQRNTGDLDFQFVKEYGMVWRVCGALGQTFLMIADPKAIQHVLHKSGYHYPKTVEADVVTQMIAGNSILSASTGQSHSRHRKVMNPAFSAPQLRTFLPIFRRSAKKLCRVWKDEVLCLGSDSSEKAKPDGEVIAVNKWLARMTLDILGETAFHCDLGALDHSNNPVAQAYHNIFADSQLDPPVWSTLFRATWRFMPKWFFYLVQYIPTREYARFRRTLKAINAVSRSLVDNAINEAQTLRGIGDVDEKGKGKKDVMSVLVRANMSENPSTQLSKHEMMAEMAALALAGHETTANALTWLLWELSKQPQLQDKLREEIHQKREEMNLRDQRGKPSDNGDGAPDFHMDDLESMPFLQALLKEVLRYHPSVYHLVRVAAKDDVIPLSQPVTTANGDAITDIPIGKGQGIMISSCAYNRLESVWGPDASQFNPMRFMQDSEDNMLDSSVKVGMYANLMSFSAGLRGCIGWRFSIIEMQAILVALIENFEFSLPSSNPEEAPEILRMPIGLMSPMVKGRTHEGVLMPLRIKALTVCT